jgi:hypothetical protein
MTPRVEATVQHGIDDADAAIRGSVYGFAVRSSVPLRYLRVVDAAPERILSVAAFDDGARPDGEPLRRWLPRPDNPFLAHLWADGQAYRLWIDGLGWYRIDPDAPEVWVPPDADPIPREERLYGIPAAVTLARAGHLPLHAATVQVGDAAVALAAPGRHGKTTLAAALMAAGHRLLSEDVSCCRLGPDMAVVPGPAVLRVRRDTFERLAIPGAHVALDAPDRVHVAVDEAERGDCTPVPLRAVLLIRPSDGPAALERVDGQDAMQDLWALSMKMPTDEDRERCFAGIASLAGSVPIFNLSRPTRWESLDDAVELVIEAVTS